MLYPESWNCFCQNLPLAKKEIWQLENTGDSKINIIETLENTLGSMRERGTLYPPFKAHHFETFTVNLWLSFSFQYANFHKGGNKRELLWKIAGLSIRSCWAIFWCKCLPRGCIFRAAKMSTTALSSILSSNGARGLTCVVIPAAFINNKTQKVCSCWKHKGDQRKQRGIWSAHAKVIRKVGSKSASKHDMLNHKLCMVAQITLKDTCAQ